MSVTVDIDTRQFEAAILECIEHTSRTIPDVINKACVDIIINAANETPKASKKAIVSDLIKEYPSTYIKGSVAVTRPAQLIYLIINAARRKAGQKALSNSEMSAATDKFIKRRIQSIGYIAYAGWNPANKALGGKGFGRRSSKPEGITSSNADSGFGIQATVSLAFATMVNCATGAAKVGAEAFQRVMDSKALDMVNRLTEKLRDQAERQKGH